MPFTGVSHKVGEHIDTDAIIPARFLVTTDPKKLGENCMEGLEHGWVKRVQVGDILVAERNFGCGSSREHAPIAILGAGMKAVIAHSFARIFYRNAFNMGLLLLEIGDDVNKIKDGDKLEVSPEEGVIKNLTTGETIKVPALSPVMQNLIDKGGLVNYVREEIEAEGKEWDRMVDWGGEREPFCRKASLSPPQTPPLSHPRLLCLLNPCCRFSRLREENRPSDVRSGGFSMCGRGLLCVGCWDGRGASVVRKWLCVWGTLAVCSPCCRKGWRRWGRRELPGSDASGQEFCSVRCHSQKSFSIL